MMRLYFLGIFILMICFVMEAQAQFYQIGNKLVGTGAAGAAYQGMSVAISGDGNTAIVGGHEDNGGVGAAWIYTRLNGVWSQQGTKLVGSGAMGTSAQGVAVALSWDGNTAIIGGPWDNSYVGAAWVFTRSGNTWTQQGNKIVGSDVSVTPFFGYSLGLSSDGNTAVIGAPVDSGQQYAAVGAACVFTRKSGIWTQQGKKLVGTNSSGSPQQGVSVGISSDGNTVIIGGPTDSANTGAAWVFTRSDSVWTQQGGKLVGTAATSAQQGASIRLSSDGNTAIIGGPYDNSGSGAAWIFSRSEGTWTQNGGKLYGGGAVGAANQGYSVAISGDDSVVIVGGPADDGNIGAAWVYALSNGVWNQQGGKLVGSGATGTSEQGWSVAISGDALTGIVGGRTDNSNTGAIWMYQKAVTDTAESEFVAYYPFNGNANDSSGNGYNGIVTGATLTTDRFGAANSAYSFDGSTSIIRCGDILDSVFCAPVAKFSVSGWAMTRTYGSIAPGGGFIIGKNGGGNAGPYQWNVTHLNGVLYAAVMSDTLAQNYVAVTSPMTTNQWFHFVLVFDGSLPELQRVKLYVNGQSSNTSLYQQVGTLGTTTENSTQNLTIGASHYANNPNSFHDFYNGNIDDIRIYNGALDSAAVQSLYHERGWALFSQPGLVLYYPFNGNANDSSRNGYNGTVAGATLTADRFGAANSAYSFDGSSSIIRCGDILDSVFSAPVAQFSVSGWAMTRTYGSFAGGGGFIIGKNGGGNLGPYQWNVTHDDGVLYGAVFSDTLAQNYIALTSPMTKNQWFHFVLVFNGSLPEMQRVKLYVNGVSTNSSVYQNVGTLGTATVNSTQNLTIGATQYTNNPALPGNFYDGNIDDIGIYNWALDSTTVQSLYHERGWPKSLEPGLVAYYPFNGNANDSSGNGYNGTVYGATLTTDRFGKSNSAYHFTGGASIGIPELFPDTVSAFTFASWVMKDTMDYNTHEIIYKGLDQGEASLGITKTTNGTMVGFGVNIETGVYGDQNWYSVNMPDTLKAKTYYFLVGRYTMGQKIDFFINGILIGSLPVPSLPLAQWPGHSYSAIGVQPQFPTTGYWNGVIDDIRVYNYAVDSATIQSLYHEGGWPLSSMPKLELYYPFSGNANDSSGNGYNGAVVNATLAADRFNHPNSAYYFNGTNSYIYVGDILDSVFSAPVAKFSVSGWAKTVVPGSKAGGGGFIMGKSGSGNAGIYEWGMAHYNDNNVYAGIYYDGSVGRYTQVTSTPVAPGNWFHFVYVYDGSLPSAERLKLYINATINLVTTASVGTPGTGTMNTAQPLTIGAGLNLPDSPNNFYNGYIDDIRIYNGVISDSAIQALFHEGGWQIEGMYRMGEDIPADFELSSNYPNPFNPSTTIRFGVPVQSRVKIEIFNILGQRVTELADTEVGAGYFEKVWQANYASGIYFYRIEAVSLSDPSKRFVATKKMLLMK
ncbi:MAG: LamG-like jellyroll fold domain-containing protein [Bacteroidota bacterium]